MVFVLLVISLTAIRSYPWFGQLSASENMIDMIYNQFFRNSDGTLNQEAVITALNKGGNGLPDGLLEVLVRVFSGIEYDEIVNISEATVGTQVALQQIGEALSTMFTENAIAFLWGEDIEVDLDSLLRRAQLFTVMGSIPHLSPGSIDLTYFLEGRVDVDENGMRIQMPPSIGFGGDFFHMSTLNSFLEHHNFLAEAFLAGNIEIENIPALRDGEVINQIMELLLSKGIEKGLRKNPVVDGVWSVGELIIGINQIIQNAGGSTAVNIDPNVIVMLMMHHLGGGGAWVQTPPDGNFNVIGVNMSTPGAMINTAMLECMGYSEVDIWMLAFTNMVQLSTYTNPQGYFRPVYVSASGEGLQGMYEGRYRGDDDTFVTDFTDLEALQGMIDEREPVDWEAVREAMDSED